MERDRDRETDKQTDRQRQRQTHKETETEKDTERERNVIYVQDIYVYSHTAKERKWSVSAKSSSLQVLELTCAVTRPR